MVQGFRTTDGAGVHLVRVLSNETVRDFDPFLMLDSFDSINPRDYIAGFPLHPHRGIETISFISKGKMVHKDSLGNSAEIGDGEVQWMTAGSGILHEERLPASQKMLGVQLWMNLAHKDKMAVPEYKSIHNSEIPEIKIEGGVLRLLAGNYLDHKGFQSLYQPLDYYDIRLDEHQTFKVEVKEDRSIMLFTLSGEIAIDGVIIKEKTAVKLSKGDYVEFKSLDYPVEVLMMSSIAIGEPVAWGGPIVMNTRNELYKAFEELDDGTFIKEKIDYVEK